MKTPEWNDPSQVAGYDQDSRQLNLQSGPLLISIVKFSGGWFLICKALGIDEVLKDYRGEKVLGKHLERARINAILRVRERLIILNNSVLLIGN